MFSPRLLRSHHHIITRTIIIIIVISFQPSWNERKRALVRIARQCVSIMEHEKMVEENILCNCPTADVSDTHRLKHTFASRAHQKISFSPCHSPFSLSFSSDDRTRRRKHGRERKKSRKQRKWGNYVQKKCRGRETMGGNCRMMLKCIKMRESFEWVSI